MFVYQPTFNTLDLKEDKTTEYIIVWKSKGLFKSRIEPLYKTFVPNIKRSEHKIRIQFNNASLALEKNNYSTKTATDYIVHDFD